MLVERSFGNGEINHAAKDNRLCRTPGTKLEPTRSVRKIFDRTAGESLPFGFSISPSCRRRSVIIRLRAQYKGFELSS